MPALPAIHLLTCPPRAPSLAVTLARFARTDWPKESPPVIHTDDPPGEHAWGDPRRHADILRAFGRMLADITAKTKEITAKTNAITAEAHRAQRNSFSPRPPRLCGESEALCGEDWFLLLEDDLDFHPRLAHHLRRWPALDDPSCEMASLFNPSLRAVGGRQKAEGREGDALPAYCLPPTAFCADPRYFTGAQALLLRRRLIERALLRWDSPDLTGMQSRRLARLAAGPIWVHVPSLVQHVPVRGGSAWGARVQTALDFDPRRGLEG